MPFVTKREASDFEMKWGESERVQKVVHRRISSNAAEEVNKYRGYPRYILGRVII
jgi:hypothetical protein